MWCMVIVGLVSLLEASLLWWAFHQHAKAIALHMSAGLGINSTTDGSNGARGHGQLQQKPLSVNYHFTRQCNYQCGFCFHTAKTSFVLPINEAKRGLKLLSEAGMY